MMDEADINWMKEFRKEILNILTDLRVPIESLEELALKHSAVTEPELKSVRVRRRQDERERPRIFDNYNERVPHP